MRRFLLIVGLVSALGLALSFAGSVHRAGDTLALLQPLWGVLMIVGAYAARTRWVRVWLGLAGVLTVASVLLFTRDQAPGGDLRLYSKNISYSNSNTQPLAIDIIAAQVDVVMLQELSPTTLPLLDDLAAQFPHQHVCKPSELYGTAVLSRTPFTSKPRCSAKRGMAAAQIEVKGSPLWLVSVHNPWLWPYGLAANDNAARALIEDLDGPKLLAGDFNAFPWGGRVARLRRLSGTVMAGPTRATLWLNNWVPLPIDHVLAPQGGSVTLRPTFGSDHLGLVADIGL